MQEETTPRLRVGTEWQELKIESEPHVAVRKYRDRMQYQPCVWVSDMRTQQLYEFLISAASVCDGLEALRKMNNGVFTGLMFEIRRKGTERTAEYEFRE